MRSQDNYDPPIYVYSNATRYSSMNEYYYDFEII